MKLEGAGQGAATGCRLLLEDCILSRAGCRSRVSVVGSCRGVPCSGNAVCRSVLLLLQGFVLVQCAVVGRCCIRDLSPLEGVQLLL